MTAPCTIPRVRRLRCGPPHIPCPQPPLPPAEPTPPVPDDPADRESLAACLRLALEVLEGRREPEHLAPRFTPTALRYWRAEAKRRPVAGPARLRRARVCRPREDVAEVGAACDLGGRVRALAARFERREGAWWCVAIRLG